MKLFNVKATLTTTTAYEDPRCPSFWRGSGVYDIYQDWEVDVNCDVWAESEARARELIESYSFDRQWDDVVVKEIKDLGDNTASDDEGVGEVEYGTERMVN